MTAISAIKFHPSNKKLNHYNIRLFSRKVKFSPKSRRSAQMGRPLFSVRFVYPSQPVRYARRKTVGSNGFVCFFNVFSCKTSKKSTFFRFFFSFPLSFSSFSVIFTVRVFAIRQERSHITFGICCENEGRASEKKRRRQQPPLRGSILGNMSWNLDKPRLTEDRDASFAVRIRRCRI